MCVWKPTLEGNFTIASAWEEVWKKPENMSWHEWFQNKYLPKKISIYNWKVWFNSLTVDDRVQKKEISLA